jgi:Domain of unknown function DUF11
VRNLGTIPAVGVVAREIPQYHSNEANRVAHVLSLTTTRGTCTSRRPVRCQLGTLAPGATVTIRSRTQVLVAAQLRSIVVVSSNTPETNTTNNMAIAALTTHLPRPVVHARVSAPPIGRVGTRLVYRVSVIGGGRAGATSVRLCTRPPNSLISVRAAGTFAYRGLRCRSVARLGRGRSMGFTVSALASARGHLFPFARATAVGVARPSRAVTRVLVLGPAVACPARAPVAKAPATGSPKAPLAHAAC